MKVKQIQSLRVIGVLTLVSICGIAYLYAEENSANSTQIILQEDGIREYSIDKIRPSDEASNFIEELRKLESLGKIRDKIYIGEGATDFSIQIRPDVLNSMSNTDIDEFVESDFFVLLEKYIGEEFKNDFLQMLDSSRTNEYLSDFGETYIDSNVIVEYRYNNDTTDKKYGETIEEYNSTDKGTGEIKLNSPDIYIGIEDYMVDPSKYKDVDKMIRGNGYKLDEITNKSIKSSMVYRDLNWNGVYYHDYIINQTRVEIGLTADILVGESGVDGATLYSGSYMKKDKDLQLESYQKDLICRILSALNIEEAAQTKIEELILNQKKEQMKPIKIDGNGYSLIANSYIGWKDKYRTRIDIIKNNE